MRTEPGVKARKWYSDKTNEPRSLLLNRSTFLPASVCLRHGISPLEMEKNSKMCVYVSVDRCDWCSEIRVWLGFVFFIYFFFSLSCPPFFALEKKEKGFRTVLSRRKPWVKKWTRTNLEGAFGTYSGFLISYFVWLWACVWSSLGAINEISERESGVRSRDW